MRYESAPAMLALHRLFTNKLSAFRALHMSLRGWLIGIDHGLFSGSSADDAEDMKNDARNDKGEISDDNNNQPEESVENLSFVDLTGTGNDEAQNCCYSGVPCGVGG